MPSSVDSLAIPSNSKSGPKIAIGLVLLGVLTLIVLFVLQPMDYEVVAPAEAPNARPLMIDAPPAETPRKGAPKATDKMAAADEMRAVKNVPAAAMELEKKPDPVVVAKTDKSSSDTHPIPDPLKAKVVPTPPKPPPRRSNIRRTPKPASPAPPKKVKTPVNPVAPKVVKEAPPKVVKEAPPKVVTKAPPKVVKKAPPKVVKKAPPKVVIPAAPAKDLRPGKLKIKYIRWWDVHINGQKKYRHPAPPRKLKPGKYTIELHNFNCVNSPIRTVIEVKPGQVTTIVPKCKSGG
jgi:hypothetical protein